MFDYKVEQKNLSKLDSMFNEFAHVKGELKVNADGSKTFSTTGLSDKLIIESGAAFIIG